MTVTVDLSTDISYAFKGEKQSANFVELIEPNFKQIEHFVPVKQAFISAITSIDTSKANVDDDAEKDEDAEINGSQVMSIMMQSSCDMTKIYLHCVELFKSGAALAGGEQKLTTPLIEAMPLQDFDKLVGEYIANFIATSLMDGMKNSTN